MITPVVPHNELRLLLVIFSSDLLLTMDRVVPGVGDPGGQRGGLGHTPQPAPRVSRAPVS